jgi:hypothetical protein
MVALKVRSLCLIPSQSPADSDQNNVLSPRRPLSAITASLNPFPGQLPNDFALFPFQPSLSAPIAWDARAALGSKAPFRVKRVANWSVKTGKEMTHQQEKIENAEPMVLKDSEERGGDGKLGELLERLTKETRQDVVGQTGGESRVTAT